MKSLTIILILIFFCGCKTISTEVLTSDDNQITMKSTEKWTFFDPEEKLKLTVAPINGGQIVSLSWEGKKIADKSIDSYPNKDFDIKKLKPRILYDDSDSDLILVYARDRGNFQLLRSYKLLYNSKTKEHSIEVIYNVKNYSSDKPINQQWINNLSLLKLSKPVISNNSISGTIDNASFKISAMDVTDLEITNDKGQVKIANKTSFALGFYEKLNWKVIYSLKSLD